MYDLTSSMNKVTLSSNGKDFWTKAKLAHETSQRATKFVLEYLDEVFGANDTEQVGKANQSFDGAHSLKVDLAHHRESVDFVGRQLKIKQLQQEVIKGISKHLNRVVEELEEDRKSHVLAVDLLIRQRRTRPVTLPPEILMNIFNILYNDERRVQVVELPEGSRVDALHLVRFKKNTISALLESERFTFSDEWKRLVLRCAPLIVTDARESRLFHGQYAKGGFRFIQVPELRSYPRFCTLSHPSPNYLSSYLPDAGSIIIMLDGLPARTSVVDQLKHALALPGVHLHLHIFTHGDNKSTKDFNPIPRFILENLNDVLHFVHILDVPPAILPLDSTTPRPYPDSYPWAPFENVTVTQTKTKVARLPVSFIRGLAPMLSSLRRLTLWIPWHIQSLGTVLSAIRYLPRCLNELCIYETRRELRQFSGIEEAHEPIQLPNLEELSFIDFNTDVEIAETISSLLNCPLLETFKFDTWILSTENYYPPKLLIWMNAHHPNITCLSLVCEVRLAKHTGEEIFDTLTKPGYGGKWLFPCLNAINISAQREEDLEPLKALAMARFVTEDVLSLNSVVISTALVREDVDYGFIDQHLLDPCVKYLRMIVPNVAVKELHRPFEIDGSP